VVRIFETDVRLSLTFVPFQPITNDDTTTDDAADDDRQTTTDRRRTTDDDDDDRRPTDRPTTGGRPMLVF
jgi:hypothetical protein